MPVEETNKTEPIANETLNNGTQVVDPAPVLPPVKKFNSTNVWMVIIIIWMLLAMIGFVLGVLLFVKKKTYERQNKINSLQMAQRSASNPNLHGPHPLMN